MFGGEIPLNRDIEDINTSVNGLDFVEISTGKWGYKIGGADPVIPFKSDLLIKKIGATSTYVNSAAIGEMRIECADFSKLKIGSMTLEGSLNSMMWIITGYVGSTPTTLYNSYTTISNSEYDISSFDAIVLTVYAKGANASTYGGVYFNDVVFSI